MMSCYVQEGWYRKALDLFHETCDSRVVPDEATPIYQVFYLRLVKLVIFLWRRKFMIMCGNASMPSGT
jgi:pentatricopeptide repeat protein